MGLSASKSSSAPYKPAQPYILQGMQQAQNVYNQQQPQLESYAADQRNTYGQLAPGATQGIEGAQGLVNDTLAGKYLNGNPYLDGIIARTNQDVTNSVNSNFESGGRYGSGMHADILTRELAAADNQARYGNYAAERQNQIGAVGQASGLMSGSQSLLNNAAELPWMGVNALNGAIRTASGGYGTQTTSPNYGQMLLQAAAAAAGAYGAGGGY